MFNSKVILITGGTGSFGKAFMNNLFKNYKPKKVIVFSRDELKQYEIHNNLINKGVSVKNIRFFLGDVRDRSRLNLAFKDVDYVVHAAALKQIPAAEYNPQECIKTNINGAENVIFAALEQGVKKVIALSTDKACSPINLYGATKLVSDKLFVAANMLVGQKQDTKFSVVRYGNVIDSRGSVIPYFKDLIGQNKKSLPITDTKMTRFFLSLDQGVEFVKQCFERMSGGEIFIPKIPSYRLLDLAKAIAPEARHEIVGMRPGEKLHEVLISSDESRTVLDCGPRYVLKPSHAWIPLPEYPEGKPLVHGFEYRSDNNTEWISATEFLENSE